MIRHYPAYCDPYLTSEDAAPYRFTKAAGGYEQIDISLAFDPIAERFFREEGKIRIIEAQDPAPGESLSVKEENWLAEVLTSRDGAVSGCQEPSHSSHFGHLLPEETDNAWLSQYRSVCSKDPAWAVRIERIYGNLGRYQKTWNEVYDVSLELWFRKLGAYFSFRYYIDGFSDDSLLPSKLLVKKSLWILRLLVVDLWSLQEEKVTVEDLKGLVQDYCRLIEFSEENIAVLKELD